MFSIQKLKKKKRHVFNSKTPSAKYGKKKNTEMKMKA